MKWLASKDENLNWLSFVNYLYDKTLQWLLPYIPPLIPIDAIPTIRAHFGFRQDGDLGYNQALGAAIGPDESVVLGGTFNVDSVNVDFTAIKLDANGNFEWEWQVTIKKKIGYNT